MRRSKRRSGNRMAVLLFLIILSTAIAFAFGAGQGIGGSITTLQSRDISQFDMVMKSRQTNPPEAKNGNALPTWSIILGFVVAIVFVLWQGSGLLESANKLTRSLKRKKRDQRSIAPSPWRVEPNPTIPAPGRPLTAVSPLLEAPRGSSSASSNGNSDSIDDVGWA